MKQTAILSVFGTLGLLLPLNAPAQDDSDTAPGSPRALRRPHPQKHACRKIRYRKLLARIKESDLSPERKRALLQRLRKRLRSRRCHRKNFRDRRHHGGTMDRIEDRIDRRKDRRDRAEDRRDRRGNLRDRREDRFERRIRRGHRRPGRGPRGR